MDYIIYGAGAIGSILGAGLAKAGRTVTLVARGPHVVAIRERGLTVEGHLSVDGLRLPAVERFADAELTDDTVVCLTMKTNDTVSALEAAGEALAGRPVVCFQNGVHNERLMEERGLRGYGGLVYCSGKFLEAGLVHNPSDGLFGIGCLPEGRDDVCERVAADITAGGLEGQVFDDIMAVKWNKLLGNLNNAFRAMTDLDFMTAAKYEDSRFFMATIMEEAVRVLRAAEIAYTPFRKGRTVDEQTDAMRRPGERSFDPPTNEDDKIHSSTWQDLKLQRGKVEVEYFNGEIVRVGKRVNVPTPYNTLMWTRCAKMARDRIPPGAETVASLQARLDDPEHHR